MYYDVRVNMIVFKSLFVEMFLGPEFLMMIRQMWIITYNIRGRYGRDRILV